MYKYTDEARQQQIIKKIIMASEDVIKTLPNDPLNFSYSSSSGDFFFWSEFTIEMKLVLKEIDSS